MTKHKFPRKRRGSEQYTALRTRHTRKHFFRVWLKKESSSQAHLMSHAPCSWLDRIPFSSTPQHSISTLPTKQEYHLQSATRSSVFAVSPNRARSQVMSPTLLSRLAVRRLRLCSCRRESKHWFDVQLWRGHRRCPCCFGNG